MKRSQSGISQLQLLGFLCIIVPIAAYLWHGNDVDIPINSKAEARSSVKALILKNDPQAKITIANIVCDKDGEFECSARYKNGAGLPARDFFECNIVGVLNCH